jgi:hypothetical protein
MPDRNTMKCRVRFGNGQNGLALFDEVDGASQGIEVP